jgi:hypothetical protein
MYEHARTLHWHVNQAYKMYYEWQCQRYGVPIEPPNVHCIKIWLWLVHNNLKYLEYCISVQRHDTTTSF